MKVIVVMGSRNPEGQTARAAGALVEGLTGAGGEAETAFLPEMNIERCRQCDERGWGTCRSEGTCVIEDDFASLVERIVATDAAVFANPVYFADLSESMRAFLDRLRRITRHDSAKERIAGKPAVGICVAGGGGGGAPEAALRLERTLAITGFDVVDMVPVRRQNLEMKQDVLRTTGRWLATGPSD